MQIRVGRFARGASREVDVVGREHPGVRAQHAGLDRLALSRARPVVEREQRGGRRRDGGVRVGIGLVGELVAVGLLRELLGRERQARSGQAPASELRERFAAERAGGRVIGGLAGAGARRAVGRPVQVDQPRVDPTQGRVVDPQPLGHARAVVVQQQVGAAREQLHDLARLGALQVEGEALLALHGLEPGDAVLHLAEGLSADRLDLDHARAELGEQRRRQRGRHPGGELEHQQVAQRAARSGRATRVRRARRRPRRPGGGPRARRGRAAGAGRRGREADQRPQLPQPPDLGILAFDHVAVVEDLRMAPSPRPRCGSARRRCRDRRRRCSSIPYGSSRAPGPARSRAAPASAPGRAAPERTGSADQPRSRRDRDRG